MNGGIDFLSIFVHGVIDGSSFIEGSGSWGSVFLMASIGRIFVGKSFDLVVLRVNIVLKASFVAFEHSNVKNNYLLIQLKSNALFSIKQWIFYSSLDKFLRTSTSIKIHISFLQSEIV